MNIGSRPSVLIVCFRFIGDVLITTPLAVSIKQAIPNAAIDYLIFEGTEGVLVNNPLIRTVITASRRGSNAAKLISLFRSYDIAIAAYPSDRTFVAAAVAGRHSIALIYTGQQSLWKKMLASAYCICDDHKHVVSNILSLLEPLKIAPVPRVMMGYSDADREFATGIMPTGNYVILHPYSRNRCKYWTTENWGLLADLLQKQGNYRVVFTSTPDPADKTYLQEILAAAPSDVITFKNPCTLGQLAAIIKGSTGFIGIDTVVTHMAASLDVPTVALFGPTLTRYWGPWPNGCTEQAPFSDKGGTQRMGRITVIQRDWECVPCNREQCAISTRGKMECLQSITAEEVFKEFLQNVARHHQE